MNKYVYCRNNPLKYTDQDGNIFTELILTAVAIQGVTEAIDKMSTFYQSYQSHKQGNLIKGLVTAGVSGFTKGAVKGVGTGVATAGTIISTVTANPLPGVGGFIFKTGSDVVAEFIEVGVEAACIKVLEDDETNKQYNVQKRLAKANIKAQDSVLWNLIEEYKTKIDPYTKKALNEVRYENFEQNWLESHVDHSRDWIEGNRF